MTELPILAKSNQYITFVCIIKMKNKKEQWFKNWFDSPYYHLLYKNRDDNEAKIFIDNLNNYLSLPQKSFLLDLACGKGRHSIYFEQKGFVVTGVDLSEQSIQFAQQFENANLSFFNHDMRLPFRVNYFDAVMNLFTSFGYFENEKDNLRVIQSAATAMKPDAVMIIDFMNSEKVLRNLKENETKTVNNINFHICKKVSNRFIIKDIEFEDKGKQFSFFEKVKALNLEDFKGYFEKSGLQLIDTFGNYQLQNFDAQQSDRLILIAKKVK